MVPTSITKVCGPARVVFFMPCNKSQIKVATGLFILAICQLNLATHVFTRWIDQLYRKGNSEETVLLCNRQ